MCGQTKIRWCPVRQSFSFHNRITFSLTTLPLRKFLQRRDKGVSTKEKNKKKKEKRKRSRERKLEKSE